MFDHTTFILLRSYYRETVADALDQFNEQIDRHPERHNLSPKERAKWAAFPEQARAHPFATIRLDPDHPLESYMRSGRIGPDYGWKEGQ